MELRIESAQFDCHLLRAVGGSVIDDYELDVVREFSDDFDEFLYASCQPFFRITHRQNDAQ